MAGLDLFTLRLPLNMLHCYKISYSKDLNLALVTVRKTFKETEMPCILLFETSPLHQERAKVAMEIRTLCNMRAAWFRIPGRKRE